MEGSAGTEEISAKTNEVTLSPETIEALSSAILDKLLTETYLGMILEDMARGIKAGRLQEIKDSEQAEKIKNLDKNPLLSFGLSVENFLEEWTEEHPGKMHLKAKREAHYYKP